MFKNRYLKYFGTMIGYILMLSSLCPEISANAVYFETNSTGSLTLGNAYWEAAFDKTKGSLEYIIDKSTGGIVCHGSKDKSLWAVNFFNDPDVYKSEVNSFSYTWDQNAGILKFYYSSKNPSGKAIDAEVTIRASEERWFEMQLHLTNKYGSLARFAHFPYNLAFSTTEIEEALYPILPGVIFQKSFFLEGRSYTGNYPGWPGVFADFVSLKTTNGDLSIYAYQPLDKFIPSLLGFIADSEDTGKFYYYHPFGAGVKNNEEYSSPWVKFRVGDGNYIDQIEAYRVDNGFDKFSDIQLKLGGDYEKIVSAPILKIEATKLKLKFSEYDDYIFKLLPSPLIYHFCGYQKGGFDQNVPDLLPPEPAWGTTEELAAMIARLHQRGDLFMPYTNPTWWDDESATLLNLPSLYTIAQVAVLHENYLPVYETYNYYYGGYVICPYSKFAIDILSTKMEENKELLQSDIIFEDQIGARQWWFDFNESSPTNLSYENGWIEHTRKYKDRLLATELGYDRLAETEIGFYGSVLLPIREGVAGSLWGAVNWKIYPMISILLRDKVLLYQHDLADYTMTSFKENFSWNLAFGYLPTMQIVNLASLNPEWVRMISDFTKYLFSKYAGERIRRYSSESEYVSCTEFDTFTVYTNWNESYPFDIEGHSIAPMGAMIKKNDGSITAGVYTSYNGISLEGKEHYLIEERSADSIILRHYLGGGTKIAVQLPQEWNSTQRFKILMYLSKGGIYIVKSYQVENGKIIFKLFEGNEDLYVESYKILRDTSSN
jgi:hypothetical protein